MTKIKNFDFNEINDLTEVLIKNLPARIKAGNDKESANINELQTIVALKTCKFINFNSKDRISFMVFDIDTMENVTAKEYFKNNIGLYNYIMERIGIAPTYIIETTKGFHFAYHLKNHVFTKQQKALNYLNLIKIGITKTLNCDIRASHRLNGVWRNPLLHTLFYSFGINYELSDFKKFIIPKTVKVKKTYTNFKFNISDEDLKEGSRNITLFNTALKFAFSKRDSSIEEIYSFINNINISRNVNLDSREIKRICLSAFNYREGGEYKDNSSYVDRNINVGIMEFPKMRNLSREEYDLETQRRQKLSAIRTVNLRDKEKNKEQLLEAKKHYLFRKQEENYKRVLAIVSEYEKKGKKINFSKIGELCKLDRKTVKKYYEYRLFEN
ncbi:primase C-terminal domain-containing protein [Aliarcobacter butzleri]|uniref:primase C-terminal domain-containing protein n=1 Tax=Aliarcobacter butzleri TaxID=28197 RepID=UPI0021B1EE8B|nr:replication initiation protein [Aliarcobacter butzleri]MCT7553684.1 replication initiation protein [Aliarcobacter butzleri]